MKRGFGDLSSRVLMAVLCSFLFVAVAEARVAHVLHINGPQWPSSTAIVTSDADDTIAAATDCVLPFANLHLPYNGTASVSEFDARYLCGVVQTVGETKIGVAALNVSAGSASYSSELLFRDARGTLNTVNVPELPDALTAADAYTLRAIASTSTTSTFLALISDTEDGLIEADLELLDGNAQTIATEHVSGSGFVFHEITTPLPIGTLVVKSRAIVHGIEPAPFYAVAFVAQREGGSPRVVVPQE